MEKSQASLVHRIGHAEDPRRGQWVNRIAGSHAFNYLDNLGAGDEAWADASAEMLEPQFGERAHG
jgi:hypothetical protein